MTTEVVDEVIDQRTTFTTGTPPVKTSATIEGDFKIPEAYADRPYLKDVQTYDDVFKKLDGAQTLIGQKVTFPTAESTPEQRQEFFRSAGMPEKAEEYAFEGEDRNQEVDSLVKELYHTANLTKEQAAIVQKGLEGAVKAEEEKVNENQEKEFEELTNKVFGDKADQIIASSKKLIDENLPQELTENIKNLSNDALAIMAGVLENIRVKYISEDNINTNNIVGGGLTNEVIREQAQKLMNDPAYKDGMHKNHENIQMQLKELYGQLK